MRRLTLTLVLLTAVSSYAAEPLQPATLPEPPALPEGVSNDIGFEPEIVFIEKDGEKRQEFKRNGKTYMIKVTPRHGVPYYLVDDRGDGQFSRREATDSGLRVPQWVIHNF